MNGLNGTDIDISVRDALDRIIENENFEPSDVLVDVSKVSDSGDGYASKTYAIKITSKKKIVNLFVKYFPIGDKCIPRIIERAFKNENTFYSLVYPLIKKFQDERNVSDPFDNVPKYYFVDKQSHGIQPVFMENIKLQGYKLRERKKEINEREVVMTLRTFGKFHAVSYAMKDQERETFEEIASNVLDVMSNMLVEFGFDKVIRLSVKQFLDKLDVDGDKFILEKTKTLADDLIKFISNMRECGDEYSALNQGDCWSNNMMYLYDRDDSNPVNIKLIDWQITRVNSPALDLSYFFYTVANREMLKNLDKYQRIYYNALSERVKELGSDPEKLYPISVFKDHWRKHSKFGLAMAFVIIKGMLYEKGEEPDLTEMFSSNSEMPADMFNGDFKNQDVYVKRIKTLLEHFIENDFC